MEIVMATKAEGMHAIIAALIVLFSTMCDPRISLTVSIVSLPGYGV
jgi:hypothetical protein